MAIEFEPIGPIAQRLEQTAHNRLVPGSNPGGPTDMYWLPGSLIGGCFQMKRSTKSPSSHGFEQVGRCEAKKETPNQP